MSLSFLKRWGGAAGYVACAFFISACAPTIQNRGWIPQDCLLDQFKPGISTKDQVQCTLGTPTLVSTFGNDTWYYVSQVTESQTSFSRPQLLKNDIYIFAFDPDDRLKSFEIIDKEKMKTITPVSRETDTRGYNVSIFKQMFKNLGRFSAGGPKS